MTKTRNLTQIEIVKPPPEILELKNLMNKMKNAMENVNSRIDQAE